MTRPTDKERQSMAEDIFRDQQDDDQTVTRGQMRQIIRDVRNDLRWTVAITIVANQTLSHVELPPAIGFIGGIGVIALGAIKLAVARA